MKIITALLCFMLSQMLWAFEYTLEFSEAEIQSRINAMLPVKKETFVVNVVVNEAKVNLLEHTDQIALASKLFVTSMAGINSQGEVKLQGRIAYESEKGAFYLHDLQVVTLDIERVPADFLPTLQQLVQSGLSQVLSKHPVYVLKNDDIRQQLLKSSLKSITIEDHKLKATLGL